MSTSSSLLLFCLLPVILHVGMQKDMAVETMAPPPSLSVLFGAQDLPAAHEEELAVPLPGHVQGFFCDFEDAINRKSRHLRIDFGTD